ncbi:hypothetical protein [Acetohalobium arabaticum]|uniref:Uncharacterized protein n=1 Tax=Acetohalobium arabaticum (strain ATCC 49924 / DSM 5501 / Z-7288) TaxID=574087 RepID=D9QT31_ACEAZ|nr:hypothetical protein [Acetohalobium arabaticum]ADL13531.1 hypothetical protein Acear_2036 [Acetohalobium arabaticum DSM 5501]
MCKTKEVEGPNHTRKRYTLEGKDIIVESFKGGQRACGNHCISFDSEREAQEYFETEIKEE